MQLIPLFLWLTQTASSGSFSTWLAVCLSPCRTWRNGRRPCLTRPRIWLSSGASACILWYWLYGGKGKKKVSWSHCRFNTSSPLVFASLFESAKYWIVTFISFLSLPVVLDLTQICDICVKEERVRYLGKGYLLMLRLAAGFSYPLTQSATLGARRYASDTHCAEIPILVIPELLSAVAILCTCSLKVTVF